MIFHTFVIPEDISPDDPRVHNFVMNKPLSIIWAQEVPEEIYRSRRRVVAIPRPGPLSPLRNRRFPPRPHPNAEPYPHSFPYDGIWGSRYDHLVGCHNMGSRRSGEASRAVKASGELDDNNVNLGWD